jgi:hypothetical protein
LNKFKKKHEHQDQQSRAEQQQTPENVCPLASPFQGHYTGCINNPSHPPLHYLLQDFDGLIIGGSILELPCTPQ